VSRTRSRRIAATALAAAALLAMAACGGNDSARHAAGGTTAPGTSGTAAPAVDALAAVQKRTSAVHSARCDGKVTVGSLASLTLKGTTDWAHGPLGTLTVTYTGGQNIGILRQGGMPTATETRYLPDAFYTDMGPAVARQDGGKEWLKKGYNGLERDVDDFGVAVPDQLDKASPTQELDLAIASPDVHEVGRETVRGVPATHYRGTVRPADLARRVPHVSDADRAALRKQFAASRTTAEQVDLWISADHLPVQVTSRATTGDGTVQIAVHYSDYGAAVHPQAPPTAETLDYEQVMKESGRATTPPAA
jgi:hypothetical protein